jgi:rubredoxin
MKKMTCKKCGEEFELHSGSPSTGKPGYANVCPECSPPAVLPPVEKPAKPRVRRPKTPEDYERKLRRLKKLRDIVSGKF